MATYVLVHGGQHGGGCYRKVARSLRAAGHGVYIPALTGFGERRHLLSPAVDLETHITDVVGMLAFDDLREVILVGHSYGGMVITGVADRALDRIGELVYLDAAHPRNEESLADAAPELMVTCKEWTRAIAGVELLNWPEVFTPELFGATYPADIAWMQPRLQSHPWRCYAQKLRLENEAAIGRLPRTDIDCASRVRAFDERRRAQMREATRAWQIDTDIMVGEPEKLTEMLLRLA